MNEAPPSPSEAKQQADAKRRQLADSFDQVFGQPRKRTEAQQRVLEHLEVCAGDDGNAYRFNEAKDGIALVAAGIHRDGAKSILRVIERQLSHAAKKGTKPKAAITVKR